MSHRPELPDHNALISAQYEKAQRLRDAGVEPYPHRWIPTHSAATALADYDRLSAPGAGSDSASEGVGSAPPNIRLAGRVVAFRRMGKACFLHILDETDRIQVYVKEDQVGEAAYKLLRHDLDLGDFVGVEGYMFTTRTGEKSLHANAIALLSKAMRQPPSEHYGLADKELRYRRRYMDLFANPTVRGVFRMRSGIISTLRRELDMRGYLEVETPMLQPVYGGATARPFETHLNALDIKLYLRIAPELYLKRLLVGGFERVYEINRNFRNEGISQRHNPEFTMLEVYTAYWDYHDTMKLVEDLLRSAARGAGAGTTVKYGEHEIAFLSATPWERLTVLQAIRRTTKIDLTWRMHRDEVVALAGEHLREISATERETASTATLIMRVFESAVEPHLVQPTFITEFPSEASPLAKTRRDDPMIAERFELYAGCMELANAYSELNDPGAQYRAFADQLARKNAGDEEAHVMDEDYVRALEYGMPPASGLGIGIDRFAMLLGNQPSIRDVILFPFMKPRNEVPAPAEDTEATAAPTSATAAPAKK